MTPIRLLPLLVAYALLGPVGSISSAEGASGAWSEPFKLSPIAETFDAALDNNGMLRVRWEGPAGARPQLGVSLATHTGRTRPAKASALDSIIKKPVGINPEYEEPVFLHDGHALRCAVTVNRDRTRGQIELLVYAQSGSLVKRVAVASQVEDTTAQVAPTCQMAAAGEQAIVEFTQQTPSTNRYQGNRQIYIVRILPGLHVTAPVPLLPPGEAQQASVSSYLTEQASLSASGWVAVAWAHGNVTRETSRSLDQRSQLAMVWLSPSGTISPMIELTPLRSARWCFKCGELSPPVPAVKATGPERALVIFGSPHVASEQVSAEHVTALQTLVSEDAFPSPESHQVAVGGQTIVVTWGGSYHTNNHCAPIRVMQWHRGRWSRPVIVGHPAPPTCLYDPTAHMNEHGQASVTWIHEISRGTSDMQGVFNF